MNKPLLLIETPLTRSGYALRGYDLALSLIKSEKYEVIIFPTRWGSTPPLQLDSENSDHELIKSHIRQQIHQQPDIHLQVTIPSEFRPLGKKSFGITAGTETTGCPPSWVEGCNRMDAVFFSAAHSVNVFKNVILEKRDQKTNQVVETIKVSKPLETLFEGVNLGIFNKETEGTGYPINKFINEIPEKFVFLCVGHWLQGHLGQDRKDIGGLIKTFYDVFKRKGSNNRPALILKSSGAGFSITERDQIVDKIQQIQEMVRSSGFKGEFPSVHLLNGEMSDEEMNALYNHPKVKAMVSFHKGEGWGRPLLEFTTTGKPVIASNWSGPVDFLNKDFAFLLPGQLTKVDRSAANEWIQGDDQWFSVNYQFAGQVLNDCYEHYDKYLEKSRKHAKFTRDNFSLEKLQERILELLDKYVNLQEPVITTPNEPKRLQLPKLKKLT